MIVRFYHESEKQFTQTFVQAAVQKYGKNILIGGDPGQDGFEDAMAAVDRFGAKKHVYLVGPGMESWSAEEAQEIKIMAQSVGIDTTDKRWKGEWYATGFRVKCKEWFTTYNAEGFYSAEIDNLDAAFDNEPGKLIAFYKEMWKFCQKNKIKTKLMMKNLSTKELDAVIANLAILKPFLAEFAMFEAGSGNHKDQIRMCKSMGIQAVTPITGIRETTNYGTDRAGIKWSMA